MADRTMNCRCPPPYDWDSEMKLIDDRLDDHLTDEETAARLAAIDRQMGAIHRERRSRECLGHAILGAIGSGVLALLTVFACAVVL